MVLDLPDAAADGEGEGEVEGEGEGEVAVEEVTILDAFVLDGMIAVRVNQNDFEFFLEPLVEGLTVAPLPKKP